MLQSITYTRKSTLKSFKKLKEIESYQFIIE
jgi:hypothetical protein